MTTRIAAVLEAPEACDVLVVGGSYAGLQAALVLGRARRRVTVVDAGRPRNAQAPVVNSFWGQLAPPPDELLNLGRDALKAYDVTFLHDEVTHIRPEAEHGGETFQARLATGLRLKARAVLLATGFVDRIPTTAGISEVWGRDVVACPHCHGWEVRDQPLAVLGLRDRPEIGVKRALLVRGWSDDVVLCTDGVCLPAGLRRQLETAGVKVREDEVLKLEVVAGRLDAVVFSDGSALSPARLFVAFIPSPSTGLGDQLGCRFREDEPGALECDNSGRTRRAGVWVAGTAAHPSLLAISAAGHGAQVATAMHPELGPSRFFT